uniref:Uncharacterized protein n=1 Tax=Physcomitrium patens TaxID=3218 RepID=A0A2K1J807_PHYPA|nr:hypothetical protein PHYPA_020756 [Physcomitrium patens]
MTGRAWWPDILLGNPMLQLDGWGRAEASCTTGNPAGAWGFFFPSWFHALSFPRNRGLHRHYFTETLRGHAEASGCCAPGRIR